MSDPDFFDFFPAIFGSDPAGLGVVLGQTMILKVKQ